jgi:hypothetical protein
MSYCPFGFKNGEIDLKNNEGLYDQGAASPSFKMRVNQQSEIMGFVTQIFA